MKLSEALMLASTLGEVPTNDSWNCCLVGISCHALGVTNHDNEAVERWPWLAEDVMLPADCPSVWRGSECRGGLFVTTLCSDVEKGKISVSRAAEIIATIEPEEVHASETIREVQSGQGPLMLPPEVETSETITK